MDDIASHVKKKVILCLLPVYLGSIRANCASFQLHLSCAADLIRSSAPRQGQLVVGLRIKEEWKAMRTRGKFDFKFTAVKLPCQRGRLIPWTFSPISWVRCGEMLGFMVLGPDSWWVDLYLALLYFSSFTDLILLGSKSQDLAFRGSKITRIKIWRQSKPGIGPKYTSYLNLSFLSLCEGFPIFTQILSSHSFWIRFTTSILCLERNIIPRHNDSLTSHY